MNKYIYKVFKFVYTTEQRVMHKDELIFGKQQFQQQKKFLQQLVLRDGGCQRGAMQLKVISR